MTVEKALEILRELGETLKTQIAMIGEEIADAKTVKGRRDSETLRSVVSIWRERLMSAIRELNMSRPLR